MLYKLYIVRWCLPTLILFIQNDYLSNYLVIEFVSIVRYENQLENFCKLMDPLLDSPPPETMQGLSSFNDRIKNNVRKSVFWAHCLRSALSLGQKDLV